MSGELKQTPIFESHKQLQGKMVPFAGWEMPVQYHLGIKQEHQHTRTRVGIFDVSHMGEIRVSGPESLATLQWLTTNDVSQLKAGQAQYSLFPNPQGGIVDDLIVYCLEPGEDYLLCVNAANTDKDFQYMVENNRGADIVNVSNQWGQIAVQGPEAVSLINKLTGLDFDQCPSFSFVPWNYQNEQCYIARTGYTGEDGGEIFVPWDRTLDLWKDLLITQPGVEPIGLAARDTLRTEMKYSLYGQEITDQTNPFEAGLGWVVKPLAKDFLGKDSMMKIKEQGPKRKLVGLEILGRGIARTGYKAFSFDNEEIGEVTSGTLSPSINKAVAIAYIRVDEAKVGNKLHIEIRNKRVEAEVVKTPFYRN